MGDEEYIEKKRSDQLYLSKTFSIGREREGQARYVSRVFDEAERSSFDTVDGEIVLRATHNDKVQIKAVVTTDSKKIQQLTLQSFRIYKQGGWQPEQQYGVTLRGEEIHRLLEFVGLATSLDVPISGRVRISQEALQHFDLDDAAKEWIKRHPDVLVELVSSQTTSRDVVSIAYRKDQLVEFKRLLEDFEYFDEIAQTSHHGRPELVWQRFFEKNRWIFGYGLFHFSVGGFQEKALEQTVAGAALFKDGKRADAVLRTLGRISAICLVEIKHHRTPLLRGEAYRSGVWQPSGELSGAVSQVIATVDAVERQYQKIAGHDGIGDPTGEEAFVVRPRSVVICGSLAEFVTENGVNSTKYRNFELFRRHLVAPDVMTFDELYERAKLIVDSIE